jgi:hypothetical protein
MDMGPAPTPKHWLGRLDVTKGYYPENCCWTTHEEQMRRRAFCRKVNLNGQRVTLAEASRMLNMDDAVFRRRIVEYGRTLKEASQRGRLTRRNDILLTYCGETLPLPEWARRTGLPLKRLRDRLRRGWPADRALRPEIRPARQPSSAETPPALPTPT